MKFKDIFFAGVFVLFSAKAFAQQTIETFSLDQDNTYIGFEVSYFVIFRVAGQFRDFEGLFVIDRDNPDNSKVDIIIKTASVDTGSPKKNSDIRGPALFNAEKYPEMIFHSKKISYNDDNAGVITGDLTLRGVQKPVVLDILKVPGEKAQEASSGHSFADGFMVTGKIKRSDFGMNDFTIPIGDAVTLLVCYNLEKCDASRARLQKTPPQYNQ